MSQILSLYTQQCLGKNKTGRNCLKVLKSENSEGENNPVTVVFQREGMDYYPSLCKNFDTFHLTNYIKHAERTGSIGHEPRIHTVFVKLMRTGHHP